MAKKVTADKIYQKDLFQNLTDSANITEKSLIKISDDLKVQIKLFSELAEKVQSTAKSVTQLAGIEKKQADALKQKIGVDKQLVALQKEKERLKQQEINTETKQFALMTRKKKEQERVNKQTQKSIALKKKESTETFKLNKRIKILSDRYKEIVLAKNRETNASRKLLRQILSLKRVRDSANESLGNHQHKVAQYERGLNKLTGTLARLGLSFGVFELLNASFDTLESFDEKIADIRKTTGLLEGEARALSADLFTIDSRTSIESLQELASAAGRLNIAGDDILGFVESADKVFVALGDDLSGTAESIATDLGKISAAFGVEGEFGVSEGIEKVGSTLNELAASSKANAGAIFDFQKRMAGLSGVADISATDIAALGALFDSTGQSIEVAATTLNELLPALSSDQARFAMVAGLTAEEFSNMLQNNPVEALKAVAEGANSSKGGLDALVETFKAFGVESSRAKSIVGVLAQNTDELTRLQLIANQAFEDNVSITEEANTKNETLKANLEKVKKELQEAVIEWNESTGASKKFVAGLKFIASNLSTIISIAFSATKAFIAYRLSVKLLGEKFKNLNLGEFIDMSKDMVKNAIPRMIAGVKGLSFTFNGLGKSIRSIPFAGFISFLVTAGPLIWDFVSGLFSAEEKMTALGEATKKANTQIIDQKSKLDSLFIQLKKTNAESQDRADLINEINETYGTTLKNLESETGWANQLKEAYTELNKQLEAKIKKQIFEQTFTDLVKKELELESAITEFQSKDGSGPFGIYEEAIADAKEELIQIEKDKSEVLDAINGVDIGRTGTRNRAGSSTDESTSGGGGSVSKNQRTKLDQLREFKRQQQLILEEFETNLLKDPDADTNVVAQAVAQKRIELARETGEKIIELDFKDKGVLIDHENKRLKDVQANETERIRIAKEANKAINEDLENYEAPESGVPDEGDQWDNLQDSIKSATEYMKTYYEIQQQNLQEEQDKQREIQDESKARQKELEDIARERQLDASESIQAELEIQKAAAKKEAELLRREQYISVLVAGLNAVSSGDSISDFNRKLVNIQALAQSVASKTPAFYKGTQTTVGDELGYTGRRDSHNVMVDENESILRDDQVRALGIGSDFTTDDLVSTVTNPFFKTMVAPVAVSAAPEVYDPELKRIMKNVERNTAPSNQPSMFATVDKLTREIMITEKRGGKKRSRRYLS